MNQEVIIALAAIVSGGGLTALLSKIFERKKQKQETKDKHIDDRIAAWQKISDRNEGRLEQLEKKIEIYDKQIKLLERYILLLEQVMIKAVPPLEIPERPKELQL